MPQPPQPPRPPGGVTTTYDLDGPGTPDDSGIFDLGVGVVPADDRRDVDFAYAGTGSIGDTVWFDLDMDGITDPEEVPLQDIRVTATFTLPGANVITLEAFTDADGQYLFTGLPFDLPVTVEVDAGTLPAGLTPTYDLDGTATPHSTTTTLTTGDPDRRDVDFGYAGSGEIGDLVWLDVDGNGAMTPDPGEPGLSGVPVTLVWDNPTGAADLTITTTTDSAGAYLFSNLPAGDYTIDLAGLPGGLDPSFDPDGGDDLTSDTTLGVGSSDLAQDFPFVGTGSIGDTVWHDSNADGVLDPAEDPLPGIAVRPSAAPHPTRIRRTTATRMQPRFRSHSSRSRRLAKAEFAMAPSSPTSSASRTRGRQRRMDASQ